MARLTKTDKARNEAAIRVAMDRILARDLPPGGRADLKTLAATAGVTAPASTPRATATAPPGPGPTSTSPKSSPGGWAHSKPRERRSTRGTPRSIGSNSRSTS